MIAIWDNRLSTGNAAIDAEHRLVLNLLNELHVAFTVNAPAVVVGMALDSLVRAVDRHFARDGLSAVGSEPDGPIREHAAITATVHRLLADWRSGAIRVIHRRSLMNLASRWIAHMGRHETRSAPARPVAAEPRELLAS